jgi:hypothetical protein
MFEQFAVCLVCVSLGIPGGADCCATKIRIGGSGVGPQVSFDQLDHSAYERLLQRFVDCKGQVCYRAWRRDCTALAELHGYLESFGRVDLDRPASNEGRIAAYINAYNALAIYGILHDYPTASIQLLNRKSSSYRVFDDLELWLDDDYYSLNAIEHELLRPLGEPRIHFALVCAAKGCPRLRNEAYTAERLEGQLADNTADFFARRSRFRIHRLGQTVKASPILGWYRDDFGESDAAVLAAVFEYLPARHQQWLAGHPCARIKHMGYNWGLNDRCPTFGIWLGRIPFALYALFEPLTRPVVKSVRREEPASKAAEQAQEKPGATPQEKPGATAEPPLPRTLTPAPRKK